MKQICLMFMAWMVVASAYGQPQGQPEVDFGKIQAAVTNALPADPAAARELLPMLAAMSSQVEGLRAFTGDAITRCRELASQMKEKTREALDTDPALAEAYQKVHRELMDSLARTTKTKKQLDAIAEQITSRMELIQASQFTALQTDKK